MKYNLNKIFTGCAIASLAIAGLTSCNDFLDREPITLVTPQAYFSNADQLAAYDMNGYEQLRDARSKTLYHAYSWNAGKTLNDEGTDNLISGNSEDLNYFAGNKEVPSGQTLPAFAGQIREWNYFINRVEELMKDHQIAGDQTLINQYLGEAYFFRAMTYYRALVNFGDYPIVTQVLKDQADSLKLSSERKPRNEVARFILKDLDKAAGLLKEKGFKNNLRINKQVALLFKSRVALFEGTFEKYHQGSGRIPGDANWPGKDMSYNKGKQFNIPGEIDFFLTQAMDAAKAVADVVTLTPNSGVMQPTKLDEISGWNKYFDMFSTVDLTGFDEVLLWKQYNPQFNILHDASYILSAGGDNIGVTKSLVNSYIMANGLPIYAAESGYKGDADPSTEQDGRDQRLQLFVFNPSTVVLTDTKDPKVKGKVVRIDTLQLVPIATENKDVTGYRPRKYTSYDYEQMRSNQVICTTGCPVFRGVEAYLNYMEACYVKNGKLDADATKYWQAIRKRAGVDTDFNKTISNTDMAKEANVVNGTIYGDLGAFSGDKTVDPTLYNIRRERRCEFISEGMRWEDLLRWRSWDPAINGHVQIEGFNLWAQEYLKYNTPNGGSLLVTSGDKPTMSPKSLSTYIRPLQVAGTTNNPLYEGMTWHKAYYLQPLGVEDFTINSTDPTQVSTTTVYQNPYWPTQVGKAEE